MYTQTEASYNVKIKKLFTICFFSLIVSYAFTGGVSEAQISYPELFVSQVQLQEHSQEISPNFKYILEDGQIHNSYTEDRESLRKLFSPDIEHIVSSSFYSKSFSIIEIDKSQIPSIQLDDNAVWLDTSNSPTEKILQGNNFSALGFQTKNVVYHRYEGQNPLFDAENAYNTMSYTTVTNETEQVLERFLFFRWTGKNMGVNLDTYMYAIDTYTGLVFAYVKIGTWNSAFGVEVPVKYDPIDIYKSNEDSARFFFEYDPIGYVSKESTIVLFDWYVEKTKANLKTQLMAHLPLGKSPYFIP